MSEELYFIIPGRVVPKQSTRFGNGRAYQSKRVTDYEKKVVNAFKEEYPHHPLPIWPDRDTPIQLVCNFYFAIPKSASRKKQEDMLLNQRPTKVPDLDNCCKAVSDAVKKVLFPDDAQIVSTRLDKYWSKEDRVEVTIRSL